MEEFAADVGRHLDRAPVVARPDSWRYRSGRFVRRHPLGVLSAAILVLLLAGFGIVTQIQLDRVQRERATAEEISEFLVQLLMTSNVLLPGGGEGVTVRQVLDRAATRLGSELGRAPETRARLLHVIADSYLSLDQFDEARQAIDSAIAIRRRSRADPLALVRDLEFSAGLWGQQGRIEVADSLAREALQLRRQLHAPGSVELAEGLVSTGCALVHQGPPREVERYLREAMALLQGRSDAPSVTLAVAMRCLGRLIVDSELSQEAGYLTEAESLLRDALALARRTQPESSLHLAMYYVDLARVLTRRGSEEGELLIRRAIALHEAAPEQSTVIPWEKVTLAGVLADRGKLVEAESLFRDVVSTNRNREVGRTLSFGMWLKDYGRVLLQCGEAGAAEATLRESLDILGPAVPPRSRLVVDAKVLLGSALSLQGRFDEADTLLADNLPFAVAIWGEADPRTAMARSAWRDVKARSRSQSERVSSRRCPNSPG